MTHFLKDMARLKAEGDKLGLCNYWAKFPIQSSISVVGALAGFAALHETKQLTGLTAFGVGYMANSVADAIGKRSITKVEKI